MPTYATPGVYVNESVLASLTPNNRGATSAVFFGEAERGPTTPTLIQDWNSYKVLFGDLDDAFDLGYAVFHFFSNGGRACYVNRILNSAALTAHYGTSASTNGVPFYPTGNLNASASLLTVNAISAGTWGNTVTVQTLVGTVAGSTTVYTSFTLVVAVDGTEVERWPDVSIDPNANRYVESVVNNYSKFIRVSNINPAAVLPAAALTYYTTALTLAGGTQGTVVDTDYTSALTGLDTIEGNLILNAVGKTSSVIVSGLVAKAASRGDSFVIIDPSSSDATLAEIQATAATFASLSNGGYAAAYAPMLVMNDPAKTGPAAIRTTFPGGALAGLFIRTEVERTVAKAPAGYAADIRGALGLAVKLSDAQIGTLYDGSPQVNSFKAVPGAGVVVFGARSLNKTNPDKFINVRRTLNYLKVALKDLTNFAVFEANDAVLWNQINLKVSSFLSDFYRSGGLKGANATQAFFVVCDDTNNTPTSIDNGIVNVQVGVSLLYPAEFIVITLSQWTGGSNAVESL
jgi:uncharacterized protein